MTAKTTSISDADNDCGYERLTYNGKATEGNNCNENILPSYLLEVKEKVDIIPCENFANVCPANIHERKRAESDDVHPYRLRLVSAYEMLSEGPQPTSWRLMLLKARISIRAIRLLIPNLLRITNGLNKPWPNRSSAMWHISEKEPILKHNVSISKCNSQVVCS